MIYTPKVVARYNICQTVKHLLNQGIDAETITDALCKQADVLQGNRNEERKDDENWNT